MAALVLLSACDLVPTGRDLNPEFEEARNLPLVDVEDTADLGCFAGANDSRIVRGPILASGDGRFQAYAEIEIVQNTEGPEVIPPCAHSSRLYLSTPARPDFREIFARIPHDRVTGNSLWLVDWSADGRTLLFGESEWQYGEDFYFRTYWLFDLEQDSPRMLNPDPLVTAHFSAECEARGELTGFTPDGALVVTVLPEVPLEFEGALEERYISPDPETPEDKAPSCVAKPTYLRLDPLGNRLVPLPEDYQPQIFGLPVLPAGPG